ncbi:MAG: HIT family protein [Acidimicrobiales bacterium]
MDCAFCSIIDGSASAHIVIDDEHTLAFLDVRPLFPGHILLVPRSHYETLADLPVDLIEPLFARARRLSSLMVDALEAEGSFVAMNNTVSQSVPHLHVHIVPRRKGDGLKGFFWPRNNYDNEAHAADTAQLLRRAWEVGD